VHLEASGQEASGMFWASATHSKVCISAVDPPKCRVSAGEMVHEWCGRSDVNIISSTERIDPFRAEQCRSLYFLIKCEYPRRNLDRSTF
jgi:hypothetical protein